MRIWSIHPKYLDSKGLIAVWRETLLAKKVLENKTKGYKNHPQLHRFRGNDSLNCINQYLGELYAEAVRRNYSFDKKKFKKTLRPSSLPVTHGQMDFEIKHLKAKLKKRDLKKWKEIQLITQFEPHPLFTVVPGNVEAWEKI